MSMTLDQLKKIIPYAGPRAAVFLIPLNEAMDEFGIITGRRQAAFLAQLAHESQQLTRVVENMNYSAQRLLEVFPKYFSPAEAAAYAYKPAKIAGRVYANRQGNGDEASGDGWKYIARGGIGITFADNYLACSKALYGDDRLLAAPQLLEDVVPACRSAAWFWKVHGLNDLADRPNTFQQITRTINGGLNGYAARVEFFERAKEALA